VNWLASIPSPDSGVFELGPLSLHMYGLMLLLGIAACIGITGLRWTRRGGDWDLVLRVAVWGVAFGIVGARAYHVITSWDEVPDEWWGVFAVWKGGLGVWGGILLGAIAGAVIVRRSGESVAAFADAVAPGLLVAQAIGRIGNWWNQELFGEPTDVSWALEIDIEHRPPEYADSETFHPTFLYEGLWNLFAAGVLLLVDRLFRIRPPALFSLYVSLYCAFRLYEETLRIDTSHELAGQRLNFWVALVLFVLSTAFFVWWQVIRPWRQRRRGARVSEPADRGPTMAIPKKRVRSPR
jgi:prolipoprotein diacylglyceryl transferase